MAGPAGDDDPGPGAEVPHPHPYRHHRRPLERPCGKHRSLSPRPDSSPAPFPPDASHPPPRGPPLDAARRYDGPYLPPRLGRHGLDDPLDLPADCRGLPGRDLPGPSPQTDDRQRRPRFARGLLACRKNREDRPG